jgi:hypothetical protein
MKRLDPNTQLYKIIEAKKASLAEKKREKPYEQLKSELEAVVVLKVPSLFNAVKSPQAGPKLIAEDKRELFLIRDQRRLSIQCPRSGDFGADRDRLLPGQRRNFGLFCR